MALRDASKAKTSSLVANKIRDIRYSITDHGETILKRLSP
jgi:hypothetical protein